MPHDVFISYPSENKPIADAICNALESKRIRCWIAPRDILPGRNYAEALYDAIDNSRIFILVFSESTNTSPHIMSEVQRAFNNNCIIIPFRTKDILPSTALQYYIGNAHWLDAITPPLDEKIDKLADTVSTFLQSAELVRKKKPISQTPLDNQSGTSQIHYTSTKGITKKPVFVILACIIGLLVLAFIFIPFLSHGSSPHASDEQMINQTGVKTTASSMNPVTTKEIPNLSGVWQGKFGEFYPTVLTISQSGRDVQGRFKMSWPDNRLQFVDWFVNGNIEGDELSIKYLTRNEGKIPSGFTALNYEKENCWFNLKNSPPNTLLGNCTDSQYLATYSIVLTKQM